ncbi:microtubule-associated protein futsch [Anopheles bellator]|uniref:microtubule-associated protein futsch n=1 Tax=Anopheles bellator TaxID=139047 RepID=UPI0026494C17|nr:microtubule-associated protein futsch [Anopheles bellator]
MPQRNGGHLSSHTTSEPSATSARPVGGERPADRPATLGRMEQDQVAPVEVNGGGEQHEQHEDGGIDLGGGGAGSDGPPSILGVGPPSPLTGCYLLIIIGEPHSQDHKDIILQRLIKGFLSWNVGDFHVDLEEELHTITLQALEGDEGKHGERLIQYASENLVTEILIHPQVNTFIQCIRNLLSSFTRHRHIIHTGYTFSGNGSWILQDGTFSVVDFMEAFQEHEVQRVLRAYPDTITMDIHCAPGGQWHTIQDKSFSRLCEIRLNPVDVLSSGSEKLNSFVAYLSSMIVPTEISELLESSDVVGNIRFSHPTLYVFPGGQGDAALFGINGFNMLVDGGFSRKSCFWDFVRHLDRLDAVLMTRINNTNVNGVSSVVERKSEAHVYPQIGHFFCNVPERKGLPSPDGDKDRDPLLVDLLEEGHQIVTNLKSLNLKAQSCYRDSEPVNLYHKVGHGTLDMYVISPARDSREVKDFLAKWNAADQRLFAAKEGKDFAFPLQNLVSICALLVWTPANPDDNITRILFPGSAPEYKILEGLEKMKDVEFMRQPVCPVKSISASLSTQVLVTKKSLKAASAADKILPVARQLEKDNKLFDNKLKMMQTDNKLADAVKASAADTMDSSADEGKMESRKTATTVASARVDSKPRPIRGRAAAAASEKKLDNRKLEQQDEKKDSISDVGSDKEEPVAPVDKKPSLDSEKSLDEALVDGAEKAKAEGAESPKPEEVKEKKKEDSPTAGPGGEGAGPPRSTKKPPSSRTTSSARSSKVDSKTPKVAERKPVAKKQAPEANKSSPTTPKKTPVDQKLLNGSATKAEQGEPDVRRVTKAAAPSKTPSGKVGKFSPKPTPAKSAKDENNRKVLEARQRPSGVTKPAAARRAEADKKEPAAAARTQAERKPISRRPKGAVSSTAASAASGAGSSPVKGKKVLKSEKDAVIRKAKLDKNGTTDSSLVSTPSADEGGVAAVTKRVLEAAGGDADGVVAGGDLEALKQQQLAELKEEQEAVREIEAVFNRESAQKAQTLLAEHREVQDSATEPEEEEEYLIIEKEEQYTEDSINEPESSATKEEEIQKHQRDSQESEKRKRDSLAEEKEDDDEEREAGEKEAEEAADVLVSGKTAAVVQICEGADTQQQQEDDGKAAPEDQPEGEDGPAVVADKDSQERGESLSPKHKQDLEEEVQEIIASAKEIAKSKMETSMDGLKTEEISSISPDEKMSSTKKTSDTRDENELELELQAGPKEHIEPPHESHHEERVSATVESGATTTAPTLPEDERIPLDEIKEDLVIEEKHVKEETKETEVVAATATGPTTAADSPAAAAAPSVGEKAGRDATAGGGSPPALVYEPLERPTPAKMQFSAQQAHMRDVVKTPDEVADLPVHEEADLEEADYGGDEKDKDKAKEKDDEKDRDTAEKEPAEEPIVVAAATSATATMAAPAAAKETDATQHEKTDEQQRGAEKSAESDKPCDTVQATDGKPASPSPSPSAAGDKDVKDADDILKDLESQIIAPDAVQERAEKSEPVQPLKAQVEEEGSERDPVPVEEELIVAQKVVPKVPSPPQTVTSVLDEIWQTPQKAEEKLDELKQLIDDKAKATASELVALKDTMVKSVAESKDEVVEKVTEEAKEALADIGQEVEAMTVQAAGEVVKAATDKADTLIGELQSKAEQVDDELKATAQKMDEKLETAVAGVSQVAAKADEALATIVAETSELERMARDLKQEVVAQLDDTKQQLEADLAKEVDKVQEKAKSGISSFFGGITDGIRSGIEKVADKMETKLKDKTDQVEAKLQQVTEKVEQVAAAVASEQPSYQAFGYERSYTQELRETHITTVDSPIAEGDKLAELKSLVSIPQDIDEDKELEELENKKMGTFVIEDVKYSAYEDANLREIKEEEEEDRVSPPQGSEKLGTVTSMPARARTPEDVAKIVANVAEVLKSDKDLEEIIPGFDPQELERKLSQGGPREEDVGTVQRMLVTASSEDGGEETVICADGTITFSKSATPEPERVSGTTTPEIKVQEEEDGEEPLTAATKATSEVSVKSAEDKASPPSSGKSSPDLKTSPTSIEEKDKHELPEKVVPSSVDGVKKTPEIATAAASGDVRKESLADQYDHIDDTRRESAISTFSERDYTKDESSIVDECRDSSRAHSISSHISDLKEDSADLKSVNDFLKESEETLTTEVFADEGKSKELSSPESVTSQRTVSEKETQGKPKPSDDKEVVKQSDSKDSSKPQSKEPSRPESVASTRDDKLDQKDAAVPEKKEADVKTEDKEGSRPASAIDGKPGSEKSDASRPQSVMSDKAPSDKSADLKGVPETEEAKSTAPAKDVSGEVREMKVEQQESSRPASAGSEKDSSRPPSATDAKAPSEKSVDLKVESREASRPTSAASEKDTSRPQSAIDAKTPSEKSVDLKAESKEASRPASAADDKDSSRPQSVIDEKAPSEKSVDLKAESKEASRPASAADTKESSRPQSAIDEKAPSEKSVDLKAESKESSRPQSVIDEKAPSEKSVDLKAESKEASRPASAADTKESSRPQSAIDEKAPSEKSVDLKAEPKETSRPQSAIDEKAPSEKSVDLKIEAKEESRPASAASEKDTSRPQSAIDAKSPSEKSVDLKAESKEGSRPASAADDKESSRPQSAIDEKAPSEKSESSRPQSAIDEKAPSEKSVDLKAESKETSRPQSAIDEKAPSEKSVDLKIEAKEESRPASAASEKDTSRPQSAIDAKTPSEKSIDLKAESKEGSRPASAADDKESSRPQSAIDEKAPSEKSVDLKVEPKEESRPASAASEKDASRPQSAIDAKSPSEKSVDLKAETKEESRPASVASEKDASRPQSAIDEKAPSEKSVDLKAESKETSRPESAIDEKASPEKDASRPLSAASGKDTELPATDRDAGIDAKPESRPTSAASGVADKAASEKSVDLQAGSKEASRPASAASAVSEKPEVPKADMKEPSEKSTEKDSSRPASAASGKESLPQEHAVDGKDTSSPASAAASEKDASRPLSALSDKALSEKSIEDTKAELSRSPSAVSEKAPSEKSDQKEGTRPTSAMSEKDAVSPASSEKGHTDLKVEPKEESRPTSAASAKDTSPSEKVSAEKEESRPTSAASVKESSGPESAADGKAASEASGDLKGDSKDDSRPVSAASGKDIATLDDKDGKDTSRPTSAVDDKAPSEKSTSRASEKDESRPASAPGDKAPSEKSLDLKAEQKPDSRPASAASGKDAASRPASAIDDKVPTTAEQKEEDSSRPRSAASEKEQSRPESATGDKPAQQESKAATSAEPSRPVSAASETGMESAQVKPDKADDKTSEPPAVVSRPESATSDKAHTEKASETLAAPQDASRPLSAASDKSLDDKAKPESVAGSDKGSRPLSAASEKAADSKETSPKTEQKEPSRPESAAGEKPDQSRPESVASHRSDEKHSPEVADPSSKSKEPSRPESAVSEKGSVQSDTKVESQAASKEPSRPESAASDKPSGEAKESPKGTDESKAPLTDSRPVLAASVEGTVAVASGKESKEPSRPASAIDGKEASSHPASAPGSHDPSRPASAIDENAKSESSRPVSASSGKFPEDATPVGTEKTSGSRSPSAASHTGDKVEVDRPASGASEKDKSPTSRPESAASHSSEKVTSKAVTSTELGSASKEPSRPASVASDKSVASESHKEQEMSVSSFLKFEESLSRRESSSTTKEDRPASAMSDGEEDGHAEHAAEKICMKESRSKSLSAVLSNTVQRAGFDGGALGVLEESAVTSRDDLDMLRSPRDSVTKIEPFKAPEAPMVLTKTFKPLFEASQFPAGDGKDQPASMFPSSGLDSAGSPDHGPSIVPGMDQMLKETVSSMKEIEKMTSTVISSTVAKKEESSSESTKTVASGLAFPVSGAADASGKSSPYLGEKSQESSAKSVSPQPDKDSLEESSASFNTFIEKDSLSESATKQQQQVSIRTSSETGSGQKGDEFLLFAGSKTPPTAPISPNVGAKDGGIAGAAESSATTATVVTTVTGSVGGCVAPPSEAGGKAKDDVSGISTPKESVPSGKSSPGLMSVHTGSTDSASKSLNLGHSSGVETSESSPKPTSPFPKVVDALKVDETRTTSGMSTPDMTRSSTPDMGDSQIERIAPSAAAAGEKSDSLTTVTTTTTTKTTTYVIKDGEKVEVDSSVHSDTVSETKQTEPSAKGPSVAAPGQLTLASTEERSLTEDYDEKDVLSPRSDISSGQASRIVAGWHDEDVPGSPMSVTSQAPLSPSTKYTYDYDLQHSSSGVSKKSEFEIDDSQDDVPPQYGSEEVKSAVSLQTSGTYKPDPMSTSFYGQLPDVTSAAATATTRSIPIPIAAGKGKTYVEYASSGDSGEQPGRKYLDEADLDFEKTFRKTDDLMTTSMHFASEKEFMAATTKAAPAPAPAEKMEMDFTSTGLPSSVTTTVTAQQSVTVTPQPQPQPQPQPAPAQTQSPAMTQSQPLTQSVQPPPATTTQPPSDVKGVLDSWGKPLGLPSPAPLAGEGDNKTTPKKERRMLMSKTRLNNEKNLRRRAESPSKAKKHSPVYVDLSYVPHHGNSYYANVEFFKRVRARYYVFSGTEPSREVYNALLEAKQTWEDKELEVTIIPTYDTDVLGYWVSENEELLAKYHIDLSPSAARCTINLQDHETSCSAYRLEF